jgi:phosphoglycerate dehydrogenase-like enzyme
MAPPAKTILVDMSVPPESRAILEAIPGIHLRLVDPSEEARHLPAAILRDVNAVFCTYLPTNHDEMRSLEFVQICSSGYSQLLGLKLPERGVRASNASGVFDVAIAEWNIAMSINLARDLRSLIRNQEAAIFDRSARFQREIAGSIMGIWGYGGIGRQTARLAKSLGLRVHVYTRQGLKPRPNHFVIPGTGDPEGVIPDRVFCPGQEKEFLSSLDFLIMAIPLTERNRGIIGPEELAALRPTAFVLNPARGPLIQEQALLQALREQKIAGAALDTHYAYPLPADHPLWRFPNVIITPHISGSTGMPCFLERVWSIFLENVRRLIEHKPLLNELTPAQLSEAR